MSSALDLRTARQGDGRSARELAAVLDVHPSTLLRWERHERLPAPGSLAVLAGELGVEPTVLEAPWTGPSPTRKPGHPGQGLRALRRGAGVGVARIAEHLDVPTHTVYNWEAGRARVPERVVVPLAELLGTDPASLVVGLRRPSPPPPVPLGTPLQRLRAARGWSQARTARALGVSRSSVRAWEQGRATPPWPAVRRLAAGLRVPVSTVARAVGVELPVELDPRRWSPGMLPSVVVTLREWSDLTQAQLAARCGCSADAVRAWEAGRHVPSVATRTRLEAALRLPAGSLLRCYPATASRPTAPRH